MLKVLDVAQCWWLLVWQLRTVCQTRTYMNFRRSFSWSNRKLKVRCKNVITFVIVTRWCCNKSDTIILMQISAKNIRYLLKQLKFSHFYNTFFFLSFFFFLKTFTTQPMQCMQPDFCTMWKSLQLCWNEQQFYFIYLPPLYILQFFLIKYSFILLCICRVGKTSLMNQYPWFTCLWIKEKKCSTLC